MPRDAVSRTANVERNGGHKWVNSVILVHAWVCFIAVFAVVFSCSIGFVFALLL